MNLKNFKIRQALWVVMVLGSLIISCNELLSPQPERLGYDYFPLETGDFRIYQTRVINYNLDGSSDTLVYQLMEVVADSSIVGDEVSYRLDRFRRANESDSWVIDSVWSARRNTYQAIVVEHNVPIIKLSFPLSEDRKWDGNAMNALDFDEFKITNYGLPYQLDGSEYAESLEMFKEDLLDPLKITNDDYHLEVFSKGVGLIHKLDINKKYCNPVDCSVPGIIEQGIVFEQKLLQIGKIE
jgi:hypothetical protein